MGTSRKEADGSRLSISGFPLPRGAADDSTTSGALDKCSPPSFRFPPAQLAPALRSQLRVTVLAAYLPHATSRAHAAG